MLIAGFANRLTTFGVTLHRAAHERRAELCAALRSARRDCRRGEAERRDHLVVKQSGNRSAEPAFQRQLQQNVARMRVDPLLSGLLAFAECPIIEGANELGQRVGLLDPRRVICRKQQPRRVRGKLPDGYTPDIAALLQFGTYLLTGSSKARSPRSKAWATTVASKILRIDARLNRESDVIGRFRATSAQP